MLYLLSHAVLVEVLLFVFMLMCCGCHCHYRLAVLLIGGRRDSATYVKMKKKACKLTYDLNRPTS